MATHNDHAFSLSIEPDAIVCPEHLRIVGDVCIGSRTIVHPCVTIIAEAGPIYIGEGNLIEEQCVIVNRFPAGVDAGQMNQVVMLIGDHNMFEVGSHCEALKVGNHNILESKARVGRGVTLTNGCVISAGCSLATNGTLPENTLVLGSDYQRSVMSDRPMFRTGEFDLLTNILPASHNIIEDGVRTGA